MGPTAPRKRKDGAVIVSFCRWSSDDFQCDAYVWADVTGGFRTEIAGRRPIIDRAALPTVPSPDDPDFGDRFVERHVALNAQLDAAHEANSYIDLPEPDGGRSYWHDSAAECAANLRRLQAAGFNIPDEAIAALDEDGLG